MNNLKSDIYKLSKALLKEIDCDLSDIELAAIVTYSILNKGYCKGAYNYINLTKNIYDEYAVGHLELNEIYGYTNQKVNSTLISFNKKDSDFFNTEANVLDWSNLIINNKEKEYLNRFNDIIRNKFNNFFPEIIKLNEEENNKEIFELIIEKFFTKKDNCFFKLLQHIIPNKFSENEYENFKNKYKIKNYNRLETNENISRTDISLILEDISSYNQRRTLEKAFSPDHYDYMIIDECLDKMKINKKDLKDFRKSNKYKDSFLEKVDIVIDENLTVEDKILTLVKSSSKMKLNAIELSNFFDKLMNNLTVEDIEEKYKKEINLIENKIYKKYPDLLKNINNLDINLKNITTSENNEYGNYLNYYEKNPNIIEFHMNNGAYSNYETCVISGITAPGYSHTWADENEDYVEIRNSLEVIALLNVKKDRKFQSRLSYQDLDNIKCYKIYSLDILNRDDLNINVVKISLKNILEEIKDKDTILVHDFIRSPKFTENQKEKLKNAMKEIEEDYKDIIFIDEHPNGDDRLILRLKSQLMKMVENKIIDFKTAIEVNKEMNFNNIEVKKLNNLDTYVNEEQATNLINSMINKKQKIKLKV